MELRTRSTKLDATHLPGRLRESAAVSGSGGMSTKASLRARRTPTVTDSYVRVNCHEASAFNSISRSLLVCGNASHALDLLPDESVQTVVTSPPYWSLRDYEVEEQIGRDDCLADYVESIVKTFEKIRRVLQHDGTVWLNVGRLVHVGEPWLPRAGPKKPSPCHAGANANAGRPEGQKI